MSSVLEQEAAANYSAPLDGAAALECANWRLGLPNGALPQQPPAQIVLNLTIAGVLAGAEPILLPVLIAEKAPLQVALSLRSLAVDAPLLRVRGAFLPATCSEFMATIPAAVGSEHLNTAALRVQGLTLGVEYQLQDCDVHGCTLALVVGQA